MKKCIAFVALIAIASSVSAAEFADLDKDKDGKLSKEEFAGKKKGLQKRFDRLDKDKDGSLSEEEFKKNKKKKKKKDDN